MSILNIKTQFKKFAYTKLIFIFGKKILNLAFTAGALILREFYIIFDDRISIAHRFATSYNTNNVRNKK